MARTPVKTIDTPIEPTLEDPQDKHENYTIEREPHGLYLIKSPNLPGDLKGRFTTRAKAVQAIDNYVLTRREKQHVNPIKALNLFGDSNGSEGSGRILRQEQEQGQERKA